MDDQDLNNTVTTLRGQITTKQQFLLSPERGMYQNKAAKEQGQGHQAEEDRTRNKNMCIHARCMRQCRIGSTMRFAELEDKQNDKLWPSKKLQALILSSQFSLGKIEHKGMRLVLRRLYELNSFFGGCRRRPNGAGYAREGTQSPRRGKRGISSSAWPPGTRMLRGTCQRRRDKRTRRNRQGSYKREMSMNGTW